MERCLRARVRCGDPAAFGVLFDDCARAVCNTAYRLTGNWSTAEEVVSLTFRQAWRHRGTVAAEGGSLRPWLLGICVNVTRNVARAARRHEAALGRLPPPAAVPDFADDLAGRLDDTARLGAVREALTRLRRGEREVIALCVWSGLDYAAAAPPCRSRKSGRSGCRCPICAAPACCATRGSAPVIFHSPTRGNARTRAV